MDQLLRDLQNAQGNESVRLHIPRTLRLIYDVRNKRDTAHLGDGFDPNLQDATLVVRNMEWVLAELVRLFHNVSPDEAHAIIVDLVCKEVPAIQLFDGTPRLLKELEAFGPLPCLALLARRQRGDADRAPILVRSTMRSHLARTLAGLDGRHLVHRSGERWYITRRGESEAELAGLIEPA